MSTTDKTKEFRYFCHVLAKKYQEKWLLDIVFKKDFWRLGVMKMLFFAVVSNKELLKTFDNWYALPNGPVESDCYNYIRSLDMSSELSDGAEQKFEDFLLTLPDNSIETPSNSHEIESASHEMPGVLFGRNTFELVDISHRYECWRSAYLEAIQSWRKAKEIKRDEIESSSIMQAIF